ncbi:putative O-antigen transporter [Lactobacillus helveticus]|nr:putative O-antigen transporter [Lactobacillus helveticus]
MVNMKVIKNYLYNVSWQILSIIVPLVTAAYISRVLRPAGVGINAFTNSIINYFQLFASVGIGYYGNRQIAYVRDNRKKMSETFWEIQIIKVIMTLVSYISFEIFLLIYDRQIDYMLAQSINIIAVGFDISWFYEGIEDFKTTVVKNIVVKALSTIAIFLFIKKPSDVCLYIVVISLSFLLGNMTLWPNLKKNLVSIDFRKLNPFHHFLPTIELFIPQIATQIYVQLNKTMLGIMVSQTAAGYYQYSDSFIKIVLAFVTSTGTVMLPHVANAVSHGSRKEVNQMLYKSFDFISSLSFPMAFGIAAVSLTLGPKYYGPGYGPVGAAMMIQSIEIIMIGWSNAIGLQYLVPINRVKDFTVSVTIGALVNVILNFPLIKIGGLNGAMWSTVISETAVTIYQLIVVRNLLDYKSLFKGVEKYFIAGFIMFIPVFWMNRNLSNTWIMMLLEIITGIFIYSILIIAMKAPIINQVKDLVLKK